MHLTSEELIRWRDHGLAADRERVVRHLAECDECGAELAELVRTRPLESPPVRFDPARFVERGVEAGRAQAAAGRSSVPWRWITLAAAAVVLTALVLPQWRRNAAPSGVTRGSALTAVAPAGDVEGALTFTWHGGPAGGRYLVEIYDAGLTKIAGATVQTTRWSPPADVMAQLGPGEYAWTVSTLDASGQPLDTAPMRRFRIPARR